MVARSTGSAAAFWSQKVKTVSTARSNPARSADPHLTLTVAAAGIYLVRGLVFLSAEGGGPSILYRWTGPAAPTLVNLKVGQAAGVQTAQVMTGAAQSLVTAFDAADRTFVMNTGAPATATGWLSIDGMFQPSAAGTFALEWTGSSAAWPITLLAGGFLEYRRIS
jgi:hypothetical protein